MTAVLTGIQKLENLLGFLADELQCRIARLGLEDATYEFHPEVDLGLGQAVSARLLRLRPLSANQQFSIFFVKLESRYLPAAVLHHILDKPAATRAAPPSDRP